MPGGEWEARPIAQPEAREYLGWQYEPPYDFYNIAPALWERELGAMLHPAPGDFYYAVHRGGQMAGYFELHCRQNAAEIGIALRPDLTGKGNGRGFLACVLAQARHLCQAERFVLYVAAWNERARRLYRWAGFEETGRQRWQVAGSAVEFIRMELPIQAFFEKT